MSGPDTSSWPVLHALVKRTVDDDLADINMIGSRIAGVLTSLLRTDAEYERALEEIGIPRSSRAAIDLQRVADRAAVHSDVNIAELELRIQDLETENMGLRTQLDRQNSASDQSAPDGDHEGERSFGECT